MTAHYSSGFIGGIAGILAAYPIDTIKVRQQLRGTITPQKYNFLSLYKGVSGPLFLTSLEKTAVFGTYQGLKDRGVPSSIAGMVSGIASTAIVTPVERLKVNMQANPKRDYISQIRKTSIRLLYGGVGATAIREIAGFGIYFTVYEILKQRYGTSAASQQFAFGAISGISSWIFIYPFDVVKTQMQICTTYNNSWQCATSLYHKQGLRVFTRGISSCLLYAGIRHGATFLGYEQAYAHFSN